ncbi:MAG: DNA replication/repair protein RecF [Pseudomonadota bacterium]
MPIRVFRAENFRCFASIDVELKPDFNLIYGRNASGKTSFLEALAYLGRGKSFRGAPPSSVVRYGEKTFTLFGELNDDARKTTLGVQGGMDGYKARSSDEGDIGVAEVARILPVQVVDPDVHELVAGSPEVRRRYLDWVAFHVEHQFIDEWRRFRRALKQRNAALRNPGAISMLSSFDQEFVRLAERVSQSRHEALETLRPSLAEHSAVLLGDSVGFAYQQGWPEGEALGELLQNSLERDRATGSTHYGPHRGDLKLRYDDRQAKRLVSRGQQKLLASAMILGATETAQQLTERTMLLLLDDPAAELDRESLSRLMHQSISLGGQLVVSSLDPGVLDFPSEPAVFHVEHGALSSQP